MLSKQSPYLASAYKQLQVISQDEEKRMEYTACLKAQLDHNQMMLEADERGEERGIKKGITQGIEQGIAQGIEQGIAQGMEQGAKQTQRTVIQTMLEYLPIDQIAAFLKLSIDEVQNILRSDM